MNGTADNTVDNTVDDSTWRGRINEILYGVQFRPRLDRALAAGKARSLTDGRGYSSPAQAYVAAIRLALAQPGNLNDEIGTPHSEEQIRAFLADLLAELDG
jgi:hypothetical protein